jgi:murein DD-endopeptidase MepM/ murein hydrolase activator NlpD
MCRAASGEWKGSDVQIIITDAWLAKSRALHLHGVQLIAAAVVSGLLLLLGTVGIYHGVVLQGVRHGWPGFESVGQLLQRGEAHAKDAFMRQNLDTMARKLGEMQARMLQMDALGERVAGLAGLNPAEFRRAPGTGGLLVGARGLSMDELQGLMEQIDHTSSARVDWFTVVESRLFAQKIQNKMVPTEKPVAMVDTGSPFGFRIDPFTGRSALHTGLDFPADVGTPIVAAAGGVVVSQEFHSAYGNLIEVDHGNDIITRYAHCAQVFVKKGDIVRRGQKIATVGSTGRSTGPHLHFEVWVSGIPQDPQRFLDAGEGLAVMQAKTAANPKGSGTR